MRKRFFITGCVAFGMSFAIATPGHADLGAGVDAWGRGDWGRAVEEWRPVAISGDADAQFNLGQAYKLGRGVPRDLPTAESWFSKAAVQGHPRAELMYGLLLVDLGKRGDAAQWLEKAVARGEPRAQLVLGTMLFNGDGVAKNFPRAYALIALSAASGLPQASAVQAQMDGYVSNDDRQKGLALARQYAIAAAPPPAASSAMAATPKASAPLAPRQAAIPPQHAVPVSKPDGGWRIQLGAFRTEANARALWTSLSARLSALGTFQPYMLPAGTLTRLRVGPFASGDAANRACAALKSASTACLPIAP